MKKKSLFFSLFIFLATIIFLHAEIPLDAKVYVAGHKGLVGSSIVRALKDAGYIHLITKTSSELDLRSQNAVAKFFQEEKPEYIFLAAAKVGGIKANSDYPANFIYDNLAIEINVIHNAYKHGVKKLLFLGSSCIYPRECPQPIKEEYLFTGLLEKTNEAYAIAKIAGIKMCQFYNEQHKTKFIACMPTNLYGPGDNFNIKSSHVLPALIAKFCTAKENQLPFVEIWGSGMPKREFLHVDDLAEACLFLMNNYEGEEIVNIGCGEDISILELAKLIQNTIDYQGNLIFDKSKPDGTFRKLLDISKIEKLGWTPKIPLEEGLKDTIDWYLEEKRIREVKE